MLFDPSGVNGSAKNFSSKTYRAESALTDDLSLTNGEPIVSSVIWPRVFGSPT